MNEIGAAGLLLFVLLASTAIGAAVTPLVPERHRSRDSLELVQLVNGMMVTFAALILGLLTASVKTSFDGTDNNLRALAVQIVRLDGALRLYGPAADEAHHLLREYTEAVIADTWPEQPKPEGNYPTHLLARPTDAPLENSELGSILDQAEVAIRTLQPQDEFHRQIQADAIARFQGLTASRWFLIERAHGTIPAPFYNVLVFWLSVIFASFGLSAPRSPLTVVTILLGAISIASVVYVILDLDTPLSGMIVISSAPMRDALAHLNR